MAYIYKIENDINHKIYIGKTTRSLEERFKEHCKEAKRNIYSERPLYKAMRKYGEEHFSISIIEETEDPEQRERYWIEYFGSFKMGYNATAGGDGRAYLDYDFIISTFKNCKSREDTAKLCGCSLDSVRRIITMFNRENPDNPLLSKRKIQKNIDTLRKKVLMLSLEDEKLKTFPSLHDAARYIQNLNKEIKGDVHGISSNIRKCCQKKRKIAYGYKWQFLI